MTEKTDALFSLIQMLSPVEKRRFRQFASLQSGEKAYMQLFDALLAMKKYDEDALKKKLEGQSVLNHLSRYKNYLHNLILKALTAFYTGPDADLSDLLRQVKISVRKRSYPKAFELIRKGKKLASTAEKFEEWLSLLKTERKLLMELPEVKGFEKKIETVRRELIEVKGQLQNLNDFEDLEDDLYLLRRRKYLVRGEDDQLTLEQVRSHPLMASEKQALSVRASRIYYRNLIDMLWSEQKFAEAADVGDKLIDLFESHPFLMAEYRVRYFGRLLMFSSLARVLDKPEKSKVFLEKLDNIQVNDQHERIQLFDKQVMGKLAYSAGTGDLRPGLEAAKLVRRKLPEFGPSMKPKDISLIWFYVTKIHMMDGDWDAAFGAVQHFLDSEQPGVREDFRIFIRIKLLVILFEQGDFIGLDSNIRSVRRFIKKGDKWYKYESAIIKFLARAEKYQSGGSFADRLKDFRSEIESITNSPLEKAGLQYYDIREWIDYKLSS